MTSLRDTLALSLARLRKTLALLRLRPFDQTDEIGRAKERHRRVLLTSAAAFLAKTASLGASLVTLPLIIKHLGTERSGIWFTITSMLAIIGVADFGLGNGLKTAVSRMSGKDDQSAIQRLTSSGVAVVALVASALFGLFLLVGPLIDWSAVFNTRSPTAAAESRTTMLVAVVFVAVNMPIALVAQLQHGLQEGYVAHVWTLVGSLLAVVGVFLGVQYDMSLPALATLLLAAPVAASLANALTYFGRRRSPFRPNFKGVDRQAVRSLAGVGLLFFTLQVAGAVAYQSDNIVITQILGVDSVPIYAAVFRLFMIAPMALGLVFAALWPAYGEALARGDIVWVRRTLRRSIWSGCVLTGVPSLCLVLLGKDICRIWLGPALVPSVGLLVGFGIWATLTGVSGPLAALLNGANVVKFQVVCAVLMAGTNLPISILLVQYVGISGAVFGSVISQVMFVILPAVLFIPKLFADFESSRGAKGEGVNS